jgi:transglutaminase-like putative cysteine protease
VADIYDALAREDQMLATLTYAKGLAPDSAAVHARMGRALLRAGRNDAAAESFRAALTLRPQDAETRELLEQLAPEPRRDEAYAIDRDTLLSRKRKSDGRPLTLLQDLTVNTVFENGLGSSFVQLGVQIHDEEGARRMRARSVQFDPETQRVDIRQSRVYRADGRVLEATETYEQQLGEPWYKIYYDTRALVVVFPDLEPGDVVELRYRVDDVAPRNLFADYFGDLHFFQSSDPRAHTEYVLIAPKKRELYFNKPKLESLKHERVEQGEIRVDRFFADDVPAMSIEPDLPGTTEIAPYLHVSTYKTWQDVGKWYWGLIRDQLYADESLKATVRELVAGAKDDREKAKRIYGWVVSHTRYVALEFGIHGYLPYRVPEIVRRGFGDCKDKASLIYTMLREAGVDARIVLTRTRRNGAINDLPASLSVFDHAIAYVPSIDLYLDGTAEHSGITELPSGDQGVTVLLVGPNSAELRRTPVLPAASNERTRNVRIELGPEGDGSVIVDETIRGVDAAGYRQTYQAEGTRKERFERTLATAYPGLALSELAMKGLDDIEQPIGVAYRIRAPQVARREGDELRLSPSSMRDLVRQMAPIPKRKYPLELGVPRRYVEKRTVVAPSGYVVKQSAPGGSVKSRFGSVSVTVSTKDREVMAETVYSLEVDQVAPTDYLEFRAFVERADDILRQRISFAPEKR